MPEIKVKHVVSFSSEDKVFKAENLLKPEAYRKWKCATPGEKNASVILQFEKASQIVSIDIGNENSAFVEILVGRSGDSSNNYEVLLVSSSFMSPLESRNGTQPNRVRMFTSDKLVQNARNEKWDVVQVVCTQPFNKDVQYGLSFIKFHSPSDPNEEGKDNGRNSEEISGTFTLNDEELDGNPEELPIGNWFSKRNTKPTLSDTGPVAIRQATFATKVANTNSTPSSFKQSPKLKQSVEFKSETSSSHKKALTAVADVIHNKVENSGILDSRDTSVTKLLDKGKNGDLPAPKKLRSDPQVKAKKTKKKRHEVMENIVFALSGFENPLRSTIRDRALEMGAKYEVNWNKSCTHLVCAFVNTPKYIDVHKKGGRIVKKEWIFDCYKKSELLPWKNYALGDSGSSTSEESEESESSEENLLPKRFDSDSGKQKTSPTVNGTSEYTSGDKHVILPSTSKRKCADENNVIDDDDSDYNSDTDCNDSCSSGDTEDEIKKISELQKQSKFPKSNNDESPISSPSPKKRKVEKQEPEACEQPLPILHDFFKGNNFFLYGDFEDDEQCSLRRFITSYNGHLCDYMNEDVKYVVTSAEWNSDFVDALENVNENLIFVRPQWLHQCLKMHKRVPYQPYVISPDTY